MSEPRPAPRERPEGHEVLLSLDGYLRARPAEVFAAIAGREHPGGGARSLFTADSRAHLVVSQGGGWYRAEYRVVPDDTGSHVRHVIVDVAPGRARMFRRSRQRVLEQAPSEFERLVRELGLELE